MRSPRSLPGARACLGALVLLACATPAPRGRDTAGAEPAKPGVESARLASLEREVRALVRTAGCRDAGSCRVAPMGWRGCGGPRDFVVYCPATTDSAVLAGKLEALRRAEQEYNEKSGMISTCEMRLPPAVELQGDRCAARR